MLCHSYILFYSIILYKIQNYCALLERNLTSEDAERLVHWGSILYRVAIQLKDTNQLSPLLKVCIQNFFGNEFI